MLVKNTNKIINNLYLSLYFDDDTIKEFRLEPDQEVKIKFNDDGFMRQISGVIRSINNNTITVDGSTKYESKLAHIKFDKILDCEYITEPIRDDADDPHKIATEEDIDKIIESIENDNASIATEDQINNLIKG